MLNESDRSGPGGALPAAIDRALGASPFLQRALQAQRAAASAAADGEVAYSGRSWLIALAREPWSAQRVGAHYALQLEKTARLAKPTQMRGRAPAPTPVERALRRTRRDLLAGLLVRDCAQLAALEEVTGAMTALADLAVQSLLAELAPALAQRLGTPVNAEGQAVDLLVLAMGKAGAGELNVSSDLDLIFVHGEVAELRAPAGGAARAIDGQEFFAQLGRQLIRGLDEVNEDGFVFRVDMRLRPHGDSGPLAVSLGMLEEYLVREGREWERFAWAKARVIGAPVFSTAQAFVAQAAALHALVEPFVYRKYFDFGAIGAIRQLHQKIREEARRRAHARAHGQWDVKLGRGGIREIEFLAQTFAIMRGGRDHRLRAQGTVSLLKILAGQGLLGDEEANRLVAHYRFLRRLEHALQYREDAQTHVFPADEAARQAVADLLGLDSGEDVLKRYRHAREDVVRSFDAMFPEPVASSAPLRGAADGPIDVQALAQGGFADPPAGAERLRQLLISPKLAASARQSVEQLAGRAVQTIAQILEERQAQVGTLAGSGADEILARWIRLMETIGGRSTYLSLLAEYPNAHERVLRLLASGGWPTEYLLRHPIVLDELIDPRVQQTAELSGAGPTRPGVVEPLWLPWIARVDAQLLAAGTDVERQMNLLRDAHHAQVFRLLLADLGGVLPLEALADHLSALADAVLVLTLRAAWRAMDGARGEPRSAPPIAIVAYGKLGGRELGYASDLDLIFVYEEGAESGTSERITALCTQLVRRVIAWLTTITSSGVLFEIDLRLRPNGNAGLLVTPIEAFERYQENADGHGAWVWEHQALTRARACAGDAALGQRVEQIRARVLRQERDAQALAAEVVAMRRRMLEGHQNRSAQFDIKHDRGGMVDVEFIVQFLVLAHAHAHEQLLANRGNIGLLALAGELGLVEATAAQSVANAYRRFRQLQHSLRLNGAQRARVDRDHVCVEIAAVLQLWRSVLGTEEPLATGPAGKTAPGPRAR